MSIIIGDIHGESYWKDILKNNWNKKDHVFFLGDYCDSHTKTGRQCIDNMKELFELANANPETIHLCVGNHDFHYMNICSDVYSGYNRTFASEYFDILSQYSHLLEIGYIVEVESTLTKYLITHAGVTNTFLTENNLTIETFQDAWKQTPEIFRFNFKAEPFGGYGEHIAHSPLWVRPNALIKDAVKGYIQIVGHTFKPEPIRYTDNLFIVCTHKENNFITTKESHNG